MSGKKKPFILRDWGEYLLSRIKEFSNNQQSMHTVDDVEWKDWKQDGKYRKPYANQQQLWETIKELLPENEREPKSTPPSTPSQSFL